MNIAVAPIRISSVEIDNLRTFQKVKIEFDALAEGGQWIVLLGNNGAGKSTFLKAIAMALVERDATTRFLQDRRAGKGLVRRGEQTANIQVKFDDERTFKIELLSGPTEKVGVQESGADGDIVPNSPWPFIVAYGSLRGRGELTSQTGSSGQIESLFIPQTPLLDPQVWLLRNKLRETQFNATDRFQKILDCICALLPEVKTLLVGPDEVEVVFDDDSKVPFTSLSDGYLTTTAWVLDMIAAWIETHPEFEQNPDPIQIQMTGIALVDEIDLHLHPVWQRDVVQTMRAVFPNMTFVVTTHSPLTILDAKPGELFVVDQISLGQPSTIRQVDIRPGSVDDILTGAWFKLNSPVDSDTAELMEKHRQLLADGRGEDDQEIKEVEGRLRKRLDGFGSSSIDRVVQTVANELITDKFENLSYEDREKARENLLRAVKERTQDDAL